MLELLIVWSIILFESIVIGCATEHGLIRLAYGRDFELGGEEADPCKIFTVIMLGIVVLNTLAQGLCIFFKIGIIVEIGLLLLTILLFYVFSKKIKSLINNFKVSPQFLCYMILILFIFLIISARSTCVGDTYGYHAQTVRWIEEYGTVKGIANIHMRLGYNSAVHALNALFSFKEIASHSIRSINGYLGLIACVYASYHLTQFKNRKNYLSASLAILMILYIMLNRNAWADIANSFYSIVWVLLIALVWLRMIEEGHEKGYFLLPFFVTYIITVKFNQAPLMLLILWILYKEISKRNYRRLYVWLAGCLMIGGIWGVRNIFVSGYLIYPMPEIDIFQLDWKVPIEVARDDKAWIYSYARTRLMGLDSSIGVGLFWMEKWVEILFEENPIIAMIVLGTPICIVIVVLNLRKNVDYIVYLIVFGTAYIVWLVTAPLPRFGWAWILIWYSLALGLSMKRILRDELFDKYILNVMFISSLVLLGACIKIGDLQNNLLIQADYNKYEYQNICLNTNILVYYPVKDGISDGNAGYWTFPATNNSATLVNLEARGSDIRDGFRTNYKICNFK